MPTQPNPSGPSVRSSRASVPPSLWVALLLTAVLVALSGRYGPHRDELYFVQAGENLSLGYPDQGVLTPLVARVMGEIAPGSLVALRVPAAVAVGAIVLLAGLLARELGGGRRAELIAAACTATGVVFLQTGHTLGTTTFDLLVWTAVTWLVVRALRSGEDRLWPVAGLVLGIGLLNKPLPAFLAAGLLAGVLIAGPRELLRNRWVWAGAGIAVVLWLPWLIWQADHGWPQLEVSAAIADGGSVSSQPRWAFLPFQLLLVGPVLAPVWIAGLVRLFRDPELGAYRFLAWTWVALAVLFVATGGKPYYLAGLLPLLVASGAVAVDRRLERGRGRARRAAFVTATVASAVIGGAIGLPLLPVDRLDPVIAANPDVAETVGWPAVAKTVARVADELPDGDRAVIFTLNYGQAGAIDRYGPGLGLPRAFSGHNGYADWGMPAARRGPVVVVGFSDRGDLDRHFEDCAVRARIDTGIDNEENGTPVWSCSAPRRPWAQLWPRLRRLG